MKQDEKFLTALVEILEELHEGVCITDGQGIILRTGKSCEALYGIRGTYQSRHVSVLEEEGVFAPSLTLIALRQRKKVAMMQPDRFGHELLVTATPIFDATTQDIVLVISYASWDSTNISDLQRHYNLLKKEIARQNRELDVLKKNLLPTDLVSHSDKMRQAKKLAQRFAGIEEAVLITGEIGTGKSNLAKYIHQNSDRMHQPFCQMSCDAFSGDILEDELFGYIKQNSQTGEATEKIGICEIADTGTLLLEDVESLSWEAQGTLLYLLKNKSYYKRNGMEPQKADIRVIATSRRDSAELEACLRKELFYLLSVAVISMPSLKERRKDIPFIMRDFLAQFNEKYRKNIAVSQAAEEMLVLYHWPGNVTELKYTIQQLVLGSDTDLIQPFHLPDNISPFAATRYAPHIDLREYVDYCEGKLILQAYEKCKTTVALAKYLGISQATAVRKLQKYKSSAVELFNNE